MNNIIAARARTLSPHFGIASFVSGGRASRRLLGFAAPKAPRTPREQMFRRAGLQVATPALASRAARPMSRPNERFVIEI